jgi:hypothetical protein
VAYGVVKGESEDKAVVSPVWTLTPGLSRGVGTSSCWGKSHTYGYLRSPPASFFPEQLPPWCQIQSSHTCSSIHGKTEKGVQRNSPLDHIG